MSTQEFNNVTTATVIFNMELTKVLLIQRSADEAFPLQFAFPGGRLQRSEDIVTAAKREVKEEVDIAVSHMSYLNTYFAGDIMMVVFVATSHEGASRGGERKSFWIDIDSSCAFDLAPNVQIALNDAVVYMKTSVQSKVLDRLGKAIDKALEYLSCSSSIRNGFVGWDHFLGRGRLGVIGTALGALALSRCGLHNRLLKDVIHYLENSVLPDGSWGLRSLLDSGEAVGIVESTLYVLSALAFAGMDPADTVVARGIDWLDELQHVSGGWGSAKLDSAFAPRVFPTAFSISVLSQIEPEHQALERAVDWLKHAQAANGSWGVRAAQGLYGVRGTAAHTARSVLALLDYDEDRNHREIERGVKWLVGNYDPMKEQGWSSSSEVTFVSEKGRMDFKHFATPWVLMALMRSGAKLSDNLVTQPLIALLREQAEDGYWTHPLAAGQIPIWAIHDCLMALNEFKGSLWRDAGELLMYKVLKERHSQLLSVFVLRESFRAVEHV